MDTKSELKQAFDRLTEAMTAFGEALEVAERERVEARDADPEALFLGDLVQVSDDPWYDYVGRREPLPEVAGMTGTITDGPDNVGDWKVAINEDASPFWVNGSCLTLL